MSLDDELPDPRLQGQVLQSVGLEDPADSTTDLINQILEKISRNEEAKEAEAPIKEMSPKVSKKSKDKLHDGVATASSSSSSHNDICRICHMGGSASSRNHLSPEFNQHGQTATPVEVRTSSSTNFDLGLLISACRCRGTVGLVHTKCLERWLTESGHTSCELCGYRYATVRVPRHGLLRSLVIWIRTFVATRQMLLDSLYLVITTPLALFSAYVCAMTLKMALENRAGDIPWTIVAMLPTCSLTLVAYWGWLLTLQRLHGRRWRQYWRENFTVRIVPDAPASALQPQEFDQPLIDVQEHDYYFDDVPEFFNLL